MRPFVTSLALLAFSVPAMAQERGSFVLDAMTTAGRHFGFGYYVTDGFSLRPSLGVGYADGYGMMVNLGTDMRWELLTAHRFSPYLTAGFNFMRNPSLVQFDSGGSAMPGADTNALRYGGGVGFRTRIKHGLSLVGEGRLMNSELQTSFAGPSIQDGAHLEAAVGISYAFN